MNVDHVMTIIGPDRPGIVESISEVVADHGGNWLESRMAHLAGQFAGILRLAVDEDRSASMIAALTALESRGLHVTVTRSTAATPSEDSQRIHLELVGHDRAGIVHEITEILATHNVNIEELSTTLGAAPMSGGTMFIATAILHVPQGLALDTLSTALEEIAADLMVDIDLREEQDDD